MKTETILYCTVKGRDFSRPRGTSYIFIDTDGHSPGTLGYQPTDDGSTLCYSGEDLNEFKRVCRNWVRRQERASMGWYE